MKSLFGKLLHFIQILRQLQVPLYAANAGFFMVLSVFPALVLILSLLRYTGLSSDSFLAFLSGILPQALLPAAKRFLTATFAGSSGFLVSVSATVSLWSASRGIHGLMTGLNAIYAAEENRGYFRTRLISLLYTVLFLAVLLLTLALLVFTGSLAKLIPPGATAVLRFLDRIISLRFVLLLFLQTALFTAIFMALPNRKNRFRDSLPGALFSSLGWQIFSGLYSLYVEHFAGLQNVYGSVYAVALSMLWLYWCLSILFYGGAWNRYLAQHRKQT